MATDGPTPPPCDPSLFNRGVCVGYFATFGACHFESLIEQVRSASGLPVDWHYVAGRAVVKAFPKDADHVQQYVEQIVKPAIDKLMQESAQ